MNPSSAPDQIINNWLEITRLLRRQMAGMKKAASVNPMQIHALIIIKEHAGLTMKEFAGFLHVTSPSATSLVNRLVRMKWVKRGTDKQNRKLVRLNLTETGVKCVSSQMKEHMKMMRDLFTLLPAVDQREFARILGKLRTNLANHTQKS